MIDREISWDHIDRDSKLPLYQQLYELLRKDILNGRWSPGDILPTESELLAKHQLSRSTVRQALDALVQDGLIYRHRGRGTFVSHPTMEHGAMRIISFTEDMRQRGFTPGTDLLSAELFPASADLAEKLQVERGEVLARIERLRLADGEPLSIEQSHWAQYSFPGILQHDFTTDSLRQIIEGKYGIRLISAQQTIQAIPAPPHMAEILSMQPDYPLLFIERLSYSQFDLPVEFLRIYHRGDRYILHNDLRG